MNTNCVIQESQKKIPFFVAVIQDPKANKFFWQTILTVPTFAIQFLHLKLKDISLHNVIFVHFSFKILT